MGVLKSILHLFLGSASLAVSWMGTTFLALAVLAGPFVFRLFVGYRANKWRGVSQALRSASLYTAAVWSVLFLIGMGRFIYRDHTSLTTANAALTKENKELRSQKSNSPSTISFDNEYASITNTVRAFRVLTPQQTETCWVRITAPRENIPVAKVLGNLASTFCRVDIPYDPSQPEDEALRGSVKDAILIHMPKDPVRDSFVVALGNSFSVRRTYDMPVQSPDNLVWLQIGQGSPWRKDPTKPGTE
jgi:hypothetical protein